MTIEPEANTTAEAERATDQPKTTKTIKRRRQRRVAKALLYVSLIVTALMILAEPWLLLPIATAAVAISLWD